MSNAGNGDGITQAILNDVLTRLRWAFGQEMEVDYVREDFHLTHPHGALLLGFSQGQYGPDRSTDAVWAERELTLPLTLVFRQLNGPHGVICYLDRVRDTLTGFVPAHCDRPLRPIVERYLGQQPGIWQYAQDWSTRTVHVQSAGPGSPGSLFPHSFGEDLAHEQTDALSL